MATFNQYFGRMRSAWLSLLLAFALAMGGVANAAAACPMQRSAALASASSAHYCCPENQRQGDGQRQQKKLDGCFAGQACRATSAVPAPITAFDTPNHVFVLSPPVANQANPPDGPLSENWRPPRTI